MNKRDWPFIVCVVPFLCLVTVPAMGWGQEKSGEEIQQGLQTSAGNYEIKVAGSTEPLDFVKKPIMKWSNSERTNQQGTVFIWERDGEPICVGSLFTYEHEGLRAKHEFHSLHAEPITAEYKSKLAWAPKEAGITWLPHAGASMRIPRSKGLRLAAMRRVAAEFSASLISPDNDKRDLRLLRTPLHRFESPSQQIVDGAIFAFALGTDPEALLVIRIRENRWEYAFARFHYWQLEASHKGKPVWNVPLDIRMENNCLGDEPQLSCIYNSFHPEPDSSFKP